MRRTDRGVALLEVLVALAIVGTTGIALLNLLATGLRAAREDAALELALAQADRTLAAYTLLRREDLDRRIGRQEAGDLIIRVQRPERTLYRIAVSSASSPYVEQLTTVVYRPGGSDAP